MKIINFMAVQIVLIISILVSAKTECQQMVDYACQVFPPNHALNIPIDSLPVHPNSNNYVASIGVNTAIHPDFGTYYNGYPMGMSYNFVGSGHATVHFTFEFESDTGFYPIPIPPLVEGLNSYTEDNDGDRHIIVVDTSSHKLYETWYTWPPGHSMPHPTDWDTYPPLNPSDWWAGSGAIFDLTSNVLRPDGWTSGDAAGLPIFPLLIRYDEVERALATDGVVHHAIRFTVQNSQMAYIWPARHFASSSTDTNRCPMGLRFRLKDTVDISHYGLRLQVILRTMKKYGIIVADNGGNWFFQSSHDDRWNADEIDSLKSFHGRDFEAVDISPWMNRPGFDPNSAAVPPASGSSVQHNSNNNPGNFILHQNYPNPFNPSTEIRYEVPYISNVVLKVYDILGREVVTLVNDLKHAGDYTAQWDAAGVASGVYFYILQAGTFVRTKKLLLIR